MRQTGSVLPLVLGLMTVLTAVAVSAARTSVANTRLLTSVDAAQATFRTASLATNAALQAVRDDPALLPGSGVAALPEFRHSGGTAQRELHYRTTAVNCPALDPIASERIDYEIRVTARGARGARSHHRQGFYVCRETCTPPCVGVETAPLPTHWYVTRPDKL
jgi:hypothetical protein